MSNVSEHQGPRRFLIARKENISEAVGERKIKANLKYKLKRNCIEVESKKLFLFFRGLDDVFQHWIFEMIFVSEVFSRIMISTQNVLIL